MNTCYVKPGALSKNWYIVDASGQVVGRLATRIAKVLRGKHKPQFAPHVDCGDYVIVINAKKLLLTGKKLEKKNYYHYSGYPGGLRSRSAGELLKTYPERILMHAVRGMMPKNRLSRQLIRKLKIYSGPEHPHIAQKPILLPDVLKEF